MEADVLWKAASHLPTGLGKRFAFPTSPTAPASDEKREEEKQETPATADHPGGSRALPRE